MTLKLCWCEFEKKIYVAAMILTTVMLVIRLICCVHLRWIEKEFEDNITDMLQDISTDYIYHKKPHVEEIVRVPII